MKVLILLPLILLVGCAGKRAPAAASLPQEAGRKQFMSYCAACHQYDGQGAGDAPPLDNAAWVTGPPERLIRIVLHGIRGKLEIQGQVYDREMPGFGQVLTNEDAAALVSFIRRHFGGLSEPVPAEIVGRVRAASAGRTEYWSVEELNRPE